MTLECAFTAETEDEACRLAREWADAEPEWTFAGILRAVQPFMPERPHWWVVSIVLEPVVPDQPTLGLVA
jgi:hypothetical protein